MTKINCYDFANYFAFAKVVTFHMVTHFLETGSERCDTFICENGDIDYNYRHYSVIMCKADKKNHFTVYGYREV